MLGAGVVGAGTRAQHIPDGQKLSGNPKTTVRNMTNDRQQQLVRKDYFLLTVGRCRTDIHGPTIEVDHARTEDWTPELLGHVDHGARRRTLHGYTGLVLE